MKKAVKFAALMLSTLMLAAAIPAVAQAKTYTDTVTYTYYPKGSFIFHDTTPNIHSIQNPAIKNVKSSNSAVVKASKKTINQGVCNLVLKLKKPGKSTVSYTLAGDTCKLKVNVNKYVNPFKKIVVDGKNVTSKLNKKNVITLSYKKYKGKNVTVTSKAKGKWNYSLVSNSVCGYSSAPAGGNSGYGVTVNQKGYVVLSMSKGNASESVYIRFK